MRNVHLASEQMLHNMEHISASNRSLGAVTQQNASIAGHNKTTAGAIAQETTRLQETVRGLELLLAGTVS
jgi:methyl-accepting chemotaxis protein